jgi:hypothetical protein
MIIQESAARCMNTFSLFGYCLFNRYFSSPDATVMKPEIHVYLLCKGICEFHIRSIYQRTIFIRDAPVLSNKTCPDSIHARFQIKLRIV